MNSVYFNLRAIRRDCWDSTCAKSLMAEVDDETYAIVERIIGMELENIVVGEMYDR